MQLRVSTYESAHKIKQLLKNKFLIRKFNLKYSTIIKN